MSLTSPPPSLPPPFARAPVSPSARQLSRPGPSSALNQTGQRGRAAHLQADRASRLGAAGGGGSL